MHFDLDTPVCIAVARSGWNVLLVGASAGQRDRDNSPIASLHARGYFRDIRKDCRKQVLRNFSQDAGDTWMS
jgi:hypothetical protein